MKRVGLALGGGGARGLAHLGVLRTLEREKVPFHCIAGTSMGAIIGACYAVNPDIASVEKQVREALASSMFARMKFNVLKEEKGLIKKNLFQKAQDFIRFGYIHIVEETQNSLFETRKLEEIINYILPDIDIRHTRIPFACVATDLTNGGEKIFTEGSLRRCVLASASIPGVFPPVKIDDIYYNDGGAVSVTPVHGAKALGARFVIACDVKSKIRRLEAPEKAKDIVERCNYITGVLLNAYEIREADVVIAPAVKHVHWIEFDRIDFLADAGEQAALAALLEIQAKLKYTSVLDTIKGWFSMGPIAPRDNRGENKQDSGEEPPVS